jgi:hypothetical protein
MPTAKETFDSSIQDATDLLDLFDEINAAAGSANPVLKRAGLVVAFTAWETYVEDRVLEVVRLRMGAEQPSFSGQFLERSLRSELKRFNNPNTEKTVKLFNDFLDLDVSQAWAWNNYDTERVKTELDNLSKKRGDAVHRSNVAAGGPTPPHLVKRDELEKAIRFLKSLVEATEKATMPVEEQPYPKSAEGLIAVVGNEAPKGLSTWTPPPEYRVEAPK